MSQEQPKDEHAEDPAARAADEFAFLARDENWDGTLSREEFEAARSEEERRQDPTAFDRYDADGSGEVSKDEFMDGLLRDRLRTLRHAAADAEEAAQGAVPPEPRRDDALED